jgi:hypothetical protein
MPRAFWQWEGGGGFLLSQIYQVDVSVIKVEGRSDAELGYIFHEVMWFIERFYDINRPNQGISSVLYQSHEEGFDFYVQNADIQVTYKTSVVYLIFVSLLYLIIL